jgi:hypothetical protein
VTSAAQLRFIDRQALFIRSVYLVTHRTGISAAHAVDVGIAESGRVLYVTAETEFVSSIPRRHGAPHRHRVMAFFACLVHKTGMPVRSKERCPWRSMPRMTFSAILGLSNVGNGNTSRFATRSVAFGAQLLRFNPQQGIPWRHMSIVA